MDTAQLVVAGAAALTVALIIHLLFNSSKGSKHSSRSSNTISTTTSDKPASVFLNKERQQVPLKEKIVISHDTRIFRFELPTPTTTLGLPTGKHFKVFCPNVAGKEAGKWNRRDDVESGKPEIERKYTPISNEREKGYFDLVIKVYNPNERFLDGGKVSQYMESLKIGDKLTVQGPFGLIEYIGKGKFDIRRKEKIVKRVGMIAGGTGITPHFQIIKSVLADPTDPTELFLLFANQTEEDILLRTELEDLQKKNPNKFHVWYTLDRPPEGWTYSTGFVNEEMLRDHMPPPDDQTIILMCGPPPMLQYACRPNLDKLGYSKEAQAEF